jgi:hypothetical protein
LYKKYKIITQGYPDFKGRYSYEYSVFKKDENGKRVGIGREIKFEMLRIKLETIKVQD